MSQGPREPSQQGDWAQGPPEQWMFGRLGRWSRKWWSPRMQPEIEIPFAYAVFLENGWSYGLKKKKRDCLKECKLLEACSSRWAVHRKLKVREMGPHTTEGGGFLQTLKRMPVRHWRMDQLFTGFKSDIEVVSNSDRKWKVQSAWRHFFPLRRGMRKDHTEPWPQALSRVGHTEPRGGGLPSQTHEANLGFLFQQMHMTIVVLLSCQIFAFNMFVEKFPTLWRLSVNCQTSRVPWQWAVCGGRSSSRTSKNRTEQNLGTNEVKLLLRGRREQHKPAREKAGSGRWAGKRLEGVDEHSETCAILFILLSKERTVWAHTILS